MQTLNIVAGSLCAIFLFKCVLEATASRFLASFSLSSLVVSYAFWYYSSEVEVYVFSALFLIVTFYTLLRYRNSGTPASYLVPSLFFCLAVLFHQTNVLFLPVLLTAFFLRPEHRVKGIIRALFLITVLVGGAYLYVGFIVRGERTAAGFRHWLMGHAGRTDMGWGRVENMYDVKKLAVGVGRTFVGGHFVFKTPLLRDRVKDALQYKSLEEEEYLVRHLPEWLATVLLILSALVGLVLLFLVVNLFARMKIVAREYRYPALLGVVWLVPYCLFFSWWEPENVEFWIAPLLPFWMFMAFSLGAVLRSGVGEKRKIFAVVFLWSLILMLFFVNALGSIIFQKNLRNNMSYVEASGISQNTSLGDVVIIEGGILSSYIRYHIIHREVIDLHEEFSRHGPAAAAARIRARIRKAHEQGRDVFTTERLLYGRADSFMRRYRITRRNLEIAWQPYIPVLAFEVADPYDADKILMVFYRLEPRDTHEFESRICDR